jgi:hypothetical protein
MSSPARKLGSTERRPITVPHYHRVKESKPRLPANNLFKFSFVVCSETEVRRLLKLLGRMGKVDEVAHDHFFPRVCAAAR